MPDAGAGPAVAVGEPVEVADQVLRLTASNPSQMTGPGTNTYLVGRTDVFVLDPGPVIDAHLDAIEAALGALGGRARWIGVTHHHPDHAPAAPALAARTGAPVLAFGHAQGLVPDVAVGDGFCVEGPDFALRALHTPGHASDHLCWMLEEDSLLFSGDHVMQGSTVVVRPPDGDMATYLAQLERLGHLDPPIAAIAPGHGRIIGDPGAVIAGIVRHRLEREEQVAAALRDRGRGTVDDLLGDVYTDVAESLLPVARGSLWAHLVKLGTEGRARVAEVQGDPADSTESSVWEAVSNEVET